VTFKASMTTVPRFYFRNKVPPRVAIGTRLVALAVAGIALSVLITAVRLTPSPTGMETHLALGLSECGFLKNTGLPCPSCGMTTSFAYFVRGNIAASTYVQPMGMILAIVSGMLVWGGGYIAISGRPAYRMLGVLPGGKVLIGVLVLGLAAWAWKIFIFVHGIDGWH
jgi:hypothetical protein